MKSWCWPLTSGEFKYICPRARMFHALVTLRNLLLATSEYCSWGFSPYMTDQTTQEGSCPSSPRCLCADMFHKKKKGKRKMNVYERMDCTENMQLPAGIVVQRGHMPTNIYCIFVSEFGQKLQAIVRHLLTSYSKQTGGSISQECC